MATETAADFDHAEDFTISPEQRHAMVAVTAYLRAEQRGFVPGRETEDWYEAAAAVDAMLADGRQPEVTPGAAERIGLRNALRVWASRP